MRIISIAPRFSSKREILLNPSFSDRMTFEEKRVNENLTELLVILSCKLKKNRRSIFLFFFSLETLLERHSLEKNVTVEELIGPTKLAVQLLKTSLKGPAIKNDFVKIDSTVPHEVRQWLMSTFTPPKISARSVGESRRKGLKGIVAGISAAIRSFVIFLFCLFIFSI